jgi:hypothetical protein
MTTSMWTVATAVHSLIARRLSLGVLRARARCFEP